MENASDPMPILRAPGASDERRSELLAALAEAAKLWKEAGSLEAYLAIFSALDSNDDEVRRLAEHSLNRRSPRPWRKEARRA